MTSSDAIQEVGFLRDIGMVTTFHCTAACRHCIVRAGPRRKEQVRNEDIQSWIRQIAEYRNGHILSLALTGGEPFSDIAHLKAIADLAASFGLIVTAVTNASWATSEAVAIATLEKLSSIRILTISTDVFHQQAIPIARVQNAVLAARALHRRYIIAVCDTGDGDEDMQKTIRRVSEFSPPETINTARIFPVGRAHSIRHKLSYELIPHPAAAACTSAHAPVIFPDGRVIACFGPILEIATCHPLMLGNLRTENLKTILDRAELNPILHMIRVWGPARLAELARQAGLDAQLPELYVRNSICSTCYQLLSNPVLANHFSELAKDRDISREIAYARAHYLGEIHMAEILCREEKLDTADRILSSCST